MTAEVTDRRITRCVCGAWLWRGHNCLTCSILLMRWCRE